MSLMTSKELTGRQEPYISFSSPGDEHHGAAALKLAERIGENPFPWQSWSVNEILKTNDDGTWTHKRACLIVPRQNGKSWILSQLIIYKLFVLNESVFFTAQQWKTAEDIYKRTYAMIDGVPSLKRRVKRKTCSQGRGTIELAPAKGSRKVPQVTMTTRSADSGRGLSEIDTLIYDEAYNLTEAEIAALSFTQLAANDPQVIFTSSAANFDQHPYCFVLTALREDGHSGEDPEYFYAEWCAAPDMPRDSEETWKFANPSYGVIQTASKIKGLMRGLSTEKGRRSFDCEALGIGEWPVVDRGGGNEPIFPIEEWEELGTDSPDVVGDSALAVDVTPDGEAVAVVSAARTRTGFALSVAPLAQYDVSKTVNMVQSTVDLNDPVCVALDVTGPAAVVDSELRRVGITPEKMNASRVTAACELFLSLLHEGKIVHDGDPRWVEALGVAEFRNVRGEMGRALTRKHGDISVLVAATFALWGLIENEITDSISESVSTKRIIGRARAVKSKPLAGVAF